MSVNRWFGGATAVAQVDTFTPANVEIGDAFTLTVTGEDGSTTTISFTATVATVANVTAGLATAWNASTHKLCTPVTAADATTALTLTADTAGVPFYVTASVTNASAVNEVQTLTIESGTPTSGNFTLTYSGQTTANIAYNASAATVQAALEALSNIDTGDVSCSGGSLPGTGVVITFTGSLAGTDVASLTAASVDLSAGTPTITQTTQGAGQNTQTLTRVATTANVGPNDYGTSANWSLGAVPVATNDVYVESGSNSITYGLRQSSVALASFNVCKAFTGSIGQADIPLSISASDVQIGYYYGSSTVTGSTRINIDCGSTQAAIEIHGSATTSADTGLQPVRVKTNNASSTLNVLGGIVGVATNYAGESAVIDSINVGDAKCTIGEGVMLTTFAQTGGTNVMQCGCTTINAYDGSLTKVGDGDITTLNVYGGEVDIQGLGDVTTCNAMDGICVLSTSGTIGTLNGSAEVDMSQSPTSRTVTTCNIYSGATLKASKSAITFMNGVQLVGCPMSKCSLDFGYGAKLMIS